LKLMPKKVPRNVGLNPVARAVAREQLRAAVRDQIIQLYMLPKGAECADICTTIVQLLNAFVLTAAQDKQLSGHERCVSLMRGAISACERMIVTDSYDPLNTNALVVGLECAQELSNKVDPKVFNAVWNRTQAAII